MPGLLIIAHAPLASSLKSVAMHTFPDCARSLEALDVHAEMSVEEVEQSAKRLLQVVRDPQALILADVFGATPCNVAQRLADGAQVRVVAGVNVPMLWRSLCYAKEPLDALVARATAGAAQGVMQLPPVSAPNQASQPSANDQTHHQNQQ